MKLNKLLLIIALLLVGCAAPIPKNQDLPVQHIVLLWLNKELSENKIEEIIKGTKALKKINQVKNVKVGKVIFSERPIVDDSFDLGIIFEFETVEAMQSYTKGSAHKAFVEKSIKGNIKKIVVYDIQVER